MRALRRWASRPRTAVLLFALALGTLLAVPAASQAEATPQLEISPGAGHAYNYGRVPVAHSVTQVFTITNTTAEPLRMEYVEVRGGAAFRIEADGCAVTLAEGESCTVFIAFDPAIASGYPAELEIEYEEGSQETFDLSGEGIEAPLITSAPASEHQYGEHALGETVSETITVENAGDRELEIGEPTVSGENANQFAITQDTCLEASLSPGQTCTLRANFVPTEATTDQAVLSIPSNTLTGPSLSAKDPETILLSGIGRYQGPVTATPSPFDYGGVPDGGFSVQVFTITNNASQPARVIENDLMIATGNGQFELQGDTCESVNESFGIRLEPGESCTVEVAFSPGVGGVSRGSLVTHFIVGGEAEAQSEAVLSGEGTPAPLLSVSPAEKSFGGVPAGETAAATFTVANHGTAALEVGEPTVEGSNRFSISADSCTNASLAERQQCTIEVRFTPIEVQAYGATLSIPSNTAVGSAHDPETVALSGEGEPEPKAHFALTPTSKAFGVVREGESSSAQEFVLTNTGNALGFADSPELLGTNPSQFAFGMPASPKCEPVPLAPGESCSVSVSFTPNEAGLKTAVLQIQTLDNTVEAALSGEGQNPAPEIEVEPAEKRFGAWEVGTTREELIYVRDKSGEPLQIGALQIAGAQASQFSLVEQARCEGHTLTSTEECYVRVKFVPNAVQSDAARLEIDSNSGGTATVTSVLLSGEGTPKTPPDLTVAPGEHNFGTVQQADPGSTTFRVEDHGGEPLRIGQATISGANANQFSIASDSCSNQEVEICFVALTFAPTVTQADVATLMLPSNAPGPTVEVGLSGAGVATPSPARIAISPEQKNFASVTEGEASEQLVTITNTGAQALHIGEVALAGAQSSQFAVITDTCANATLTTNSCEIEARFAPTKAASDTAQLEIHSNSTAGALATVALAGVGAARPASPPTAAVVPPLIISPVTAAAQLAPAAPIVPVPAPEQRVEILGSGHDIVVRRGFASVPVTCSAETTCTGTVELQSRAYDSKLAGVVYGRSDYTVHAGKTVRVKVRMDKAGTSLFDRRARPQAYVYVHPSAGLPAGTAFIGGKVSLT